MNNKPASGFVDSNIIIYSLNNTSSFQDKASKFLKSLLDSSFYITPQVILETYNVITDVKKAIEPLTPQQANSALNSIIIHPACILIIPTEKTLSTCIELATHYNVKGKQKIYDCYLAATLLENHIETLYTANTEDFAAFPFLHPHNPL